MSIPKLFEPTQVEDMKLSHPDANHVPLPHVAEYYEQRSSTYGSLLISEATFIAQRVWSDAQISAWKTITDRVHAKGSYIYLQLFAMGRAGAPDTLTAEGFPHVSASDVPITGEPAPRPLTIKEIQEYVQLYATAASNAVHKAGFDGFLHNSSNLRIDAHGGSIEKRARFPFEVVDAVVKAVGQKNTAFRISPWGTFQDMHMNDPEPTFAYVVTQLRERHPELAYLHVVEPRADGDQTVEIKRGPLQRFRAGLHAIAAFAVAERKGDLIGFARPYIANPDLPYRLLHGIALAAGNRVLYYAPGSIDPKGYTDYPFAPAVVEAH
ncbi:hypothetical protein FB451DRAFT_1301277 [Mycena latifolia]|nr:hypothetical protein FB451DRAFT_1301277 [Mycena latifolia]